MSRERLVELLEQVSPTARAIPKSLPGPQTPDIEFPEVIRSRVEASLRSVPEFARIEEYTLQTISWGSSISFFRLSISVLERLSVGVDPDQIVNDLVDFAGRATVRTYYLAGIGGISLEKTLQLTDRLSLVAAADLQPSSAKEFVFRINKFGHIPGSIGHEIPRPQAALMVSSDQQVLLPKKSAATSTNRLSMDAVREFDQRTLFCLTLASVSGAPVFTAKTSWIDHPAQSYHGLTGSAGGTSPAQQYPLNYVRFDADLMTYLFNRVEDLQDDDRITLFLAVERLRRSRLHQEAVNRAIDLGTALEIMLLHKVASTQELRFRVAVHGARLLGTNTAQRGDIFQGLLNAYDARSVSVHTGRLSKKPLIDGLPQADEICRKIAIRITSDGGFPADWKSIVLAD
jgi:hypothetical protein